MDEPASGSRAGYRTLVGSVTVIFKILSSL
jgi:hypothetical protein